MSIFQDLIDELQDENLLEKENESSDHLQGVSLNSNSIHSSGVSTNAPKVDVSSNEELQESKDFDDISEITFEQDLDLANQNNGQFKAIVEPDASTTDEHGFILLSETPISITNCDLASSPPNSGADDSPIAERDWIEESSGDENGKDLYLKVSRANELSSQGERDGMSDELFQQFKQDEFELERLDSARVNVDDDEILEPISAEAGEEIVGEIEPKVSLSEDLNSTAAAIEADRDNADATETEPEITAVSAAIVLTKEEERDQYVQRLVDEVSFLELVEYILGGVEREQLRIVSKPHDTVVIRQALRKFIDQLDQAKCIITTESEKIVREETQRWNSALLERDLAITTTALRQYCEYNNLNSKSQIALARFYRNSTFSESVRSKFDLVVTRLFSNELTNHKRELVFEREDLIDSLTELYADWSSIPVYEVSEEDSELVLAAFKFEDFIAEAKGCRSIDELLTSGFFKRVKSFKKKTGENFFAPLLVASAIECNVAVGNRYVDLIAKEKGRAEGKNIGERFGRLHDSNVSAATSKSLKLVEILNEKKPTPSAPKKAKSNVAPSNSSALYESGGKRRSPIFTSIILFFIIAGGMFAAYSLYYAYFAPEKELTADEKRVQLERSFIHEYIGDASIVNDTFRGKVKPAWNDANDEKKREIVGKLFLVGKSKGFSKVELSDDSGKIVASTQGSEIEITN